MFIEQVDELEVVAHTQVLQQQCKKEFGLFFEKILFLSSVYLIGMC